MVNIDLTKIAELDELLTPTLTDWLVIRDNATLHTKKIKVGNVLGAQNSTLITVKADGTGDYPTIQQALDAVPTGGAKVYITAGSYSQASDLVIKKDGTVVVGDGLNTQITFSGPSISNAFSMNSTLMEGIVIRDLYCLRSNTTGTATCFNFSDTPLAIVENVRADDFNIGIKIADTTAVSAYSSYSNLIFNCNTGIQLSGTSIYSNTFGPFRIRCLSGGAGKALDIQTGTANLFISPNCEPPSSAGITGIALSSGVNGNIFLSPFVAGNATGVSVASGAVDNIFIGGQVSGNTTDISDSGTLTKFIGTVLTGGAFKSQYPFPMAIFRDEKTSGTAAGASSAATTHTRTLNTEHLNTITGCSLASNQITLPAGTYRVRASAPAFIADNHKLRFYNVTDAAYTLEGQTAYNDATDAVQTSATLTGRFTISAQKVFELRHYITNAKATNGLGVAVSQGTEVYAEIEIVKES